MEAETAEPSRVGEVLGEKYRLLRVIGEGGMGAVYEAENEWTKRRVALKLLRPEFTRNKEAVRRFRQEAQTATQIAHPNIVDVLDMGQDARDGAMYIVQEFLHGIDLRQRLERDKVIEPRDALDILVPIMGALVAAHKRGVVHRDIKPENIFLSRGRNGALVPKLIDFGISKVTAEANEAPTKTRAGTAVGTPEYMSPEQARGDTSIDDRTDVWSVGVVLFEMLCGRPPFDAPSYNLLVAKVMFEQPPRIETFAPDVSPDLAAIVHRALQTDRDQRLPSMRAFLSALLDCPIASSSRDSGGLAVRHKESLPAWDDGDEPASPPQRTSHEPPPPARESLPGPAPRESLTAPAPRARESGSHETVAAPLEPEAPRVLADEVPAMDLAFGDGGRPSRELTPPPSAPFLAPDDAPDDAFASPARESGMVKTWAVRAGVVILAGLGTYGIVRVATGPGTDTPPSTSPNATAAAPQLAPGASVAAHNPGDLPATDDPRPGDFRSSDHSSGASHSHGGHGSSSGASSSASAMVPDAGSVPTVGPRSVDALMANVTGHTGSQEALPDQPAPAQVSATLRGLTGSVRTCAHGETGVAHVRVVIRGDGTVERASVAGPLGASANACIGSVVRAAHFPRFRAPSFSLDYPFAVTAHFD